jgi:nicotinate dehydrogenase subunit B
MRKTMKNQDFNHIEMEAERDDVQFSLRRREFVKLLGGGIFVFFTTEGAIPGAQEKRQESEVVPRGFAYPDDFNAYLRIDEDGKVTVFTGKIEMGQGIITALAQEAADELGVAFDSIEMVMGDTDLCPYDNGTFGSQSVRQFGQALRNAAAEARAVLVALAAEQLKTPQEKLALENGTVFIASDKSKRVSFGQLAKGQKIARRARAKVSTKSVAEFKVIGQSIPRPDGRAKVTGKAKYTGDTRVPGMVYARILRPPVHGARLLKADTSAAAKIPGVTIVHEDGLIAALHADPETAAKALDQIQAQYDTPAPEVDDTTIYDYLLKSPPPVVEQEKRGDLAAGEKAAAQVLVNKFVFPYGAHAPIETHTALAKIEGGKATVWISTQGPFPARQTIAKAIGFAPEDVHVITPLVGGAFGGKYQSGQSVEAARLAKITGKPVMVMWTREEEFFLDSFRPASIVVFKTGMDTNGKICLWDYSVYYAGQRSSENFYDSPHAITRVYGRGTGGETQHPFATGAWRSPGGMVNTFARECHIDIMAAKAKMDPLDFRLQNISEPRVRKVLLTAAEKFGWKKAAAPSGRGVGMACGYDAETYVAKIAEITLDRSSGNVRLKRLVCAQDMGTVVNPEGAIMQAEGCIMMALGYTFTEEVHFKGGNILTRSFSDYEVPKFSVMPEIEVTLVKNDSLPPKGGGEPAIVGVGAAVANAFYNLTGARFYQFPMTPDRVKKILASV